MVIEAKLFYTATIRLIQPSIRRVLDRLESFLVNSRRKKIVKLRLRIKA